VAVGKLIIAPLMVIILCGCSSVPSSVDQANNQDFLVGEASPAKLAANDLVFALVQTEEVQSFSGPIQLTPIDTEYYIQMSENLKNAGFSIRNVGYDEPQRSHYSEESVNNSVETNTYSYSLTVNGVTAMREYEDRNNGIFPTSKMRIEGTQSTVRLDESEFQDQDPNQVFLSGVEYIDRSEPDLVAEINPEVESNIESIVEANAVANIDENNGKTLVASASSNEENLTSTSPSLTSPASAESPLVEYAELINADPEELENLYLTNESSFGDIFDEYLPVSETVIVFANDSKVLGPKGKQRVRDLFSTINPDTDIVGLIGCSHGKTDIDDGNRVLAIGRVLRVKNEFTDLGVDNARVFAEGCWAPVHYDEVFPRRGVVVSIMREKT